MTISVYHSYPPSTGTVCARSPDAAIAPAILPNYLSAPEDRDALLAGLRFARHILSMPPLRKWGVEETLPGPSFSSDEDLRLRARERRFGYHLVGTCRMGGDLGSVVDPRLNVRGVRALRVVMHPCPAELHVRNSNGPTIMGRRKAATMVLADAGARKS